MEYKLHTAIIWEIRLERVYSIMQDAKLPVAFSDVYSAYLNMWIRCAI